MVNHRSRLLHKTSKLINWIQKLRKHLETCKTWRIKDLFMKSRSKSFANWTKQNLKLRNLNMHILTWLQSFQNMINWYKMASNKMNSQNKGKIDTCMWDLFEIQTQIVMKMHACMHEPCSILSSKLNFCIYF